MNATIEQSNNRTKINKKGFTLAEVLITLAVIGVVAALAIPALQSNTNDQETVTQLKKTYSTLQNAVNATMLEYGTIGDLKGRGFLQKVTMLQQLFMQ